MADITCFNKLELRGGIYRHIYVKVFKNIKFEVNTKFVLGLPKTKQLGLEHCKNKHKGL